MTSFEMACEQAKELNVQPEDQLKLYGLYKQATLGNAGQRPWTVNMVEHAKWSAWNNNKDKPQQECEQEYIQLVQQLSQQRQGWIRVSQMQKPEQVNTENPFDWVINGQISHIKQLQDFNQRENGLSLLHMAVDRDQQEIIQFLLQKISVNVLDDDGNPPIYYAIVSGNQTLIQRLIDAGADLSIKNTDQEVMQDLLENEH
ncbi:acyl CoA binding protein-domain-containing protein [Gorgonomyces haynaldii]|nr:acyl CoA binding protein-domain-containing protein [Gorgonomyces haynaldii]